MTAAPRRIVSAAENYNEIEATLFDREVAALSRRAVDNANGEWRAAWLNIAAKLLEVRPYVRSMMEQGEEL